MDFRAQQARNGPNLSKMAVPPFIPMDEYPQSMGVLSFIKTERTLQPLDTRWVSTVRSPTWSSPGPPELVHDRGNTPRLERGEAWSSFFSPKAPPRTVRFLDQRFLWFRRCFRLGFLGLSPPSQTTPPLPCRALCGPEPLGSSAQSRTLRCEHVVASRLSYLQPAPTLWSFKHLACSWQGTAASPAATKALPRLAFDVKVLVTLLVAYLSTGLVASTGSGFLRAAVAPCFLHDLSGGRTNKLPPTHRRCRSRFGLASLNTSYRQALVRPFMVELFMACIFAGPRR